MDEMDLYTLEELAPEGVTITKDADGRWTASTKTKVGVMACGGCGWSVAEALGYLLKTIVEAQTNTGPFYNGVVH